MTFEEWWGDEPKHGMITAGEAWKAAQTAERERIKSRVKDAAENLWCTRNQVGDEPYALYIGPSMNAMEQFVEKLLEEK